MGITLKPQDDSKVSLFANWGEAAIFWLSLAGLILVAVIVVVKALDRERARGVFEEYQTKQQQILQKLERLEEEKKIIKAENDSLKAKYEKLRLRIDAEQRGQSGAQANTPPPLTDPEKNRSKFLRVSK